MKGPNRKIIFLLLMCAGFLLANPVVQQNLVKLASSIIGRELNSFFWQNSFRISGAILCILSGLLFLTELLPSLKARREKVLASGLIVVFYFILFFNSSSVPLNDDYFSILDFANRYQDANSAVEKWSLISSFHGECRLIFTRLYSLLFLKIAGHLPFRSMIFVANICLLIILSMFLKRSSEDKKSFLLVCGTLLLFQFSFYDAQVWATDAIHYQFSILFLCLFLWFLEKEKLYQQILAFIFAVLAVITFGNGFLVFPLALFYFLSRKKWKSLLVWTLLAALSISIYFSSSSSYPGVQEFPLIKIIVYSFCFLGGGFQFFQNLWLPFVAGLFIWVFFLYLIRKKYYLQNYFLFGLLFFIIASSLIAGIFRIHIGIEEAISNRYGIFSILGILSTIFILYDIIKPEWKEKFSQRIIVSSFVFYFASAFFFYPEIPARRKLLNEFSDNFQNNKQFIPRSPVIPPQADSIMRESVKRGIMTP